MLQPFKMTTFCLLGLVVSLLALISAAAEPSNEQLVKLTRANDEFGLQLLHRLELEDQAKRSAKPDSDPANLFISPFSVSTVMTMLMAGAANKTFDELRSTLG